jgi:hypothetical protein
MSKTKTSKVIEIQQSDDEIELSLEHKTVIDDVSTVKNKKNGQPKKEYILTEARKKQFEIARNKRQENITIRNEEKEKATSEYTMLKKELDKKLAKKEKRNQTKELLKLMAETKNISSSESEQEEIIVRKKKSAKKKKVVYVSESESESEQETQKIAKPKREILRSQTPTRELRPIIRFF